MMIYLGMSLMLIRMYSGPLSGVIRKQFEISIVMNFAPLLDIILLNKIFSTNISAVGYATSPG